MTNVGLELLTDRDMYLTIEERHRGEISMISNCFSKTNNLQVPDYGPKQETSDVIYLDVNNLYAWGMSQPLPTGEFDCRTVQEIASVDIPEIPDDDEQGCILGTVLRFFTKLYKLHHDYIL